MAHEIEINENGFASMAYAGDVPWHGLGQKVSDNATPNEIMVAAGLDWKVFKLPTFIETSDNEKIYTGKDALVRDSDNAILDTVGEDWKPVQNQEAFDFFCDFVEKGNMKMDTAGSLKNGKIVWALAKIQDNGFTLFNGDEVKGYLLFNNPHQYGKSIDIKFCATRVVCNNTMTIALKENGKNSVKVNHRSQFDAKKVKEILGLTSNIMDNFKETAQYLGSKRYVKSDLIKYYTQIFGKSEKEGKDLSRTGENVMGILETQPGSDFAPGSWWQVFNSVTFATDHMLGRANDSRLESAWFGVNATKKQKALELALDFANKS